MIIPQFSLHIWT